MQISMRVLLCATLLLLTWGNAFASTEAERASAKKEAEANIVALNEVASRLFNSLTVSMTAFGGSLPTDSLEANISDAYVELERAAKTQAAILGWVEAEQRVAVATSLWSDEEFRNTFDKIDNIGVPAGLVVAALALLDDGSDNSETAGWGLIVSLGSKLLGSLFGNQTGSKFEEKAGMIEVSRAAYTDLQVRCSSLIAQKQEAELMRGRVNRSAAEFNAVSEVQENMAIVLQYARSIDMGFQQIRTHTSALRESASRFAADTRLSEKARSDMQDAAAKAKEAEDDWDDDVVGYLSVLPRVQQILGLANELVAQRKP